MMIGDVSRKNESGRRGTKKGRWIRERAVRCED